MAKDKTEGMQRIDLRIPSNIYSDIEAIAIERGLPYAPTTKPNRDGTFKRNKNGDIIEPKVSVSPVILDLIELGLTHLKKNGKEVISGGNKEVENNSLLVDILRRLEALEKLSKGKAETEYVKNLNAIDVTPIVTPDNDISTNELIFNKYSNNVLTDNLSDTNKENITLKSTLSESPIEPSNKDLGDKVPNTVSAPINEDIKSFDEAVTVATKLKKDGLGNTAIAKELTGKFYTKANKTNWSDTQVRRLFETKK
jgi:hypothetical protein